ncbi:hypothetical protein L6452_40596 [Arctium lappa]|uniref:Uncharacterized protein n=1 Tax=Arctium lappa TaxID=4217 RepID=A0ACB8XN31_ARCLA|nr:hypothetical protein L6452_40596 [Arctium lappa]
MKQMKDLNDIPLHEVYDTLRQNEEEVEEKRTEKKKKVEKVSDPIALVAGEKEKEKKEKKKKKKKKIFYKKPGSNSQRYSSSGSKNHEHKEKIEGRRFKEKKYVEKRPEERKKFVNDYAGAEKKIVDLIKCYNCGKVSHYAKECRKPKVRNSEYYKNKMLLAKQQEADKALMAEEEFWLDHSDEEEREESAHMCLMDDTVKYDDFDGQNGSYDVIGNKDLIDSLRKYVSDFKNEKDRFESKISDFESKMSKSVSEKQECVLKAFKLQEENKSLTNKVNGLEAKLYARGQTDQTIFLNTPNEEADVREKWGLGYENPHYLMKAIRKQPTLYTFDFLFVAVKYPHLKPRFVTKSHEEVEAKEDEKRKNLKKIQLPFCYQKLNDSYISDQPKCLSNDYFESYSTKELEEKPLKAKIYVPPLILESKIIELENILSDERILADIEQNVFYTVLKNTNLNVESQKCSTSSKASHTSEVDVDDLFASANDFLNSDEGCVDEIDLFDFNAPLPDHSTFVINGQALPSVHEVGESSTKVGDTVSVNADYYAKVNSKGSEERKEWRPKRKIDESSESSPDMDCNRYTSSSSDVTRHMWYLDSGCSKHMTGQKDLLSNYTEKFCGNVRFGNDQFSPILGYGDVIQENVTITKVNFKAKSCSLRTKDGKELLVGTRKYNLYTINISKVQTDSQVCLLTKASMQQSWLWHRRLSHLNFRYINKLVKGRLVKGLPELRYEKEHLCEKEDYLEFVGITHQYSAARMPEQNGVVERLNRTIVEAARTMLSQSDLPLFLWAEAVSTACYTHNRSIIHRRCFVLNDRENLNKFGQKAEEGIFIGYSQTSAAYRIYMKSSKTVIKSVNVTFDEEVASEQSSSEPVLTGVLASGQFRSKLPKFVVVDRSEDSMTNHPTTSDVSNELVPPVQKEAPVQTITPSVEVAPEIVET